MSDSKTDYMPTIGLEIHAELQTRSKMFCGCKNDANERNPNVHACPICMGHPGTLPVINKEAVKKVLQVGAAVSGSLADFSEFDRKNYFYPDIPKGYQISQYKFPLVAGGQLAGVAITRIHLEEDTARSAHDSGTDTDQYSLVDFNRAGVPLMELVTEPVMHSADDVMRFGRELQLLLQYLGVSEANMEKGEMRVEVNISISKNEKFGTKVEVKNINSFRAAGRAVEYEIKRQSELLDRGESVQQETRGFDESTGQTFSQRSKEDSHDYRYFPEPDLPKMKLSEISDFSLDVIRGSLLETPDQKRTRFIESYGVKTEDIEVYINNKSIADFFEKSVESLSLSGDKELAIKTLSNYVTSDIVGIIKKSEENAEVILTRIDPLRMATLIDMFGAQELSSRGVKDILGTMAKEGGDPRGIAESGNLIQKNDPEEVRKNMKEILSNNLSKVEEYKAGKESILQFFVGQGMKAAKGSGNPELIKQIFLELIKE